MASSNSIEKSFQECLKNFETRLSAKERQQFQSTSLRDLRQSILQIQTQQAAKSKAMHLQRLQRFLEGCNQMSLVIEVFLNASQFVAFVWGPMKFLLQTTCNFSDTFDILLHAYEQIGEAIPLVEQYRALFQNNSYMQEALTKIYEDILEFHRRALRFFTLPTWHQLFKSIWKDFNARFNTILQDLRRHKALIESQASVIHLQEYQSDRDRLFKEIELLEFATKNRQYTEILQWMSAAESLLDHENVCSVRHDYPDSGLWLLRRNDYLPWRQDSVPRLSTLWLNAMPGAGKTVLASCVIEDCRRDTNAQTAYFYCKHDDPLRTKCTSILKALVSQLLHREHDLLAWIYDQYLTSGQVQLTSTDLCKELLKAVLLNSKKIYIVIDGLDECEPSHRRLLLNTLGDILKDADVQEPGKLRLMILSQNEPDIRKNLALFSEINLKKSDNESDIQCFVKLWCKKIQQKFELSDDDGEFMCNLTCLRAEGMFLFAKLVMNNLYDQVSLAKLQEQILPSVFPSGLDQAYERILDRVNQLPTEQRKMATTVLGWMLCSRRPLKWSEIQGITSIDEERHEVNFLERKSHVHITEICGPLVNQLPGDRLELVHSTAKHYLEHTQYLKPSTIEYRLANLCLKYLTFGCFDSDLSDDQRRTSLLEGHFAFQDYAVVHWSDHLYRVVQNGLDMPSNTIEQVKEDFGIAVVEFVERYQISEHSLRGDQPQEGCDKFRDFDFVEDLEHLVDHIKQCRAKGIDTFDKIDPEGLEDVVVANRTLLETFAASGDSAVKQNLVSCYGKKWYKCRKAACFYFHEGFENDSLRQAHLLRHDRPFRCLIEECETGYKLGFTTKRDLDKHTAVHHPDLVDIGPRFSKLKKGRPKPDSQTSASDSGSKTKHPASHACHLCPKRFTRANILKTHLLSSHTKERPFACDVCGSTFARDNDRKRHEQGHGGERKFVCEFKCTIPPLTRGCGKEFLRKDALASHWQGAGKACIAPMLEEQKRQEKWELQLDSIRGRGSRLPIPAAIREKYPDLKLSEWIQILEQPLISTPQPSGTPPPLSQQSSLDSEGQ